MIEHGVWILSGFLAIIIVSLHYEVMMLVSDRIVPWAEEHVHNRRVIAFAIAGLMAGHIAEIWLFALALRLAVCVPALGSIQGEGFAGIWEDYLYLSSVNYTSLGDGAMHVTGPIRAIAATEPLVGMMMIAWSASFTYLKMEQIWRKNRRR